MSMEQNICKQNQQTEFDLQYHLCKQFFSQPRADESIIDEISLMIEQNKILKNIRQEISGKRDSEKRILTEGDLNESVNLSMSSLIFRPPLTIPIKRSSDHSSFWEAKGDKISTNTTLDDDIRIKRATSTRIISETEIEKALNDVEEKCEPGTMQVIRHLISKSSQITKKLRESEDTIESLHKIKKTSQQLKLAQAEYERKLLDYENRVRGLEQENTTLKQNSQNTRRQSNDANAEKQKQLSKMEISLVLKQKLIGQDIKKANNKLNLLARQQAFVTENRKAAEEIWDDIVNKLQTPGDQFKSTIYTKCKQSLMTQRKHLQQEQLNLDSQHEYIQRIISQMQTIL